MSHTSTVGWTPEPQGRGTVGLVWSCLMTIFLCSWSAVHPNLPAATESPWQILWRRTRYMILAVMVPEWIVLVALLQLQDARKVRAKSPSWTLQQSFFVIMGGYVVQLSPSGPPTRLSDAALVRLFDNGVLGWPPAIDDEIADRSKSDSLVKSLTLLQALWFAAQVAARAGTRLPVSTLELFTLGIVVCAAFTYGAWWAKPFNVQRPVVLYTRVYINTDIFVNNSDVISLLEPRTEYFDLSGPLKGESIPYLLTAFVSLVFGTIHLLGWAFFFCSPVEKWLWRAGSVACTVLPITLVLLLMWFGYHEEMREQTWAVWGLFMPGIVLYVCARVLLFVLVFIGLREVPGGVYQTIVWMDYWPVFG